MVIEGVHARAVRMNSPTTELPAAQSHREHIEAPDPSSKDCASGQRTGRSAPAGTAFQEAAPSDVSLPETVSHLHQRTSQPQTMDPISLSTVPGPPSSSHPSVVSAPCLISEHILCSIMVGDLHTPVASISVPHLMDNYQVQEGMTEVTSYTIQPVVSNVSEGEQQVDLCEPGPVFLSLECAPTHTVDDLARGKDVNLSGIPNQLPQYYQTANPLYDSRDQIASIYPIAISERAADTVCESKLKKPCHCSRSQCLKLYCECFANGVMCSNCDCSNCYNNAEHEIKRDKAIKSRLGRNPDAFRSKFAGGKSREVKGWHNKGCNCKRSGCLKNYCECYEANIMCTSSCKCIACGNFDNSSGMGLREKTDKVISASVITSAVVEAVCGCLLAQAEKAEKEAQSSSQAEHSVLNEFGHCLTQIVKAILK